MPWFRIDDGFYSHPKVVAAGNAATGLYCRMGAWCSDHTTDGLIPVDVARLFGTRKEIAALLESRLWVETDGAYRMRDFLEYNPSEEQVKDRRAKTAKRVADWRARNATCNTVTNGVGNGVSNAAPDPTRPDPSSSSRSSTTSSLRVPVVAVEDDQDQPLNADAILRAIGQP